MPRRAVVLVSCLLVAGGVAGCGSTEVAGDVVPKTTPELTPPPIELGAAPAASGDDDTGATGASGSTGATGSASPQSSGTPPSGGGTATPVTPAPATPASPAPTAPTPPTGGADDGSSTTPDADPGAKANPGGASPGSISDFCTQNPGACGQ